LQLLPPRLLMPLLVLLVLLPLRVQQHRSYGPPLRLAAGAVALCQCLDCRFHCSCVRRVID
jgi:hypothetical protein